MNVDIFACIHFREFRKLDSITWIIIQFSMTVGLCIDYISM